MLVVFPLGLFVTAVIFDAIDRLGGSATFGQVGFWNIGAGLIGAVLAASAGWIDWTGIPTGTRAKRIGLVHGTINGFVTVLFLVAFLVRLNADSRSVSWPIMVLELIALAASGVAAWFGGELVDRLGVGVDHDASVDASSSLARK
jgi:uncharacterized membrane protein